MFTIGSNLLAQQAARNMGVSYGALSSSVSRLASGERINSARDDAAGLAVRELIRSDVAIARQASRNANDAVSMLQTAEGAAGQINELLLRMKSLAEQSATESYSESQRNVLEEEFQHLVDEITRVAENTEFNGRKLLAEDESYNIHVGGNSGDDAISVRGADLTSHGLDLCGTRSMARFGVGMVDPHDTSFHHTGVTVQTGIVVRFQTDGDLWAPMTGAGDRSMWDIANAFNEGARNPITGKVNYTDPPWQGPDDYRPAEVVYDKSDGLYYLEVSGYTKGTGNEVYQVYDGTGMGWSTGSWETTAGEGDHNVSIETQTQALEALNMIDDAIAEQSSVQARLGSNINRLEWSSRVLDVQAENLLASESRISDADLAIETARMTRNQVLAQAGVSMLAQANSLPQMALKLLGTG